MTDQEFRDQALQKLILLETKMDEVHRALFREDGLVAWRLSVDQKIAWWSGAAMFLGAGLSYILRKLGF